MTEAYRIPKLQIPVDVLLAGGPMLPLTIFLSERAQSHAGYERPSDLLNGPDLFIPATDKGNRIQFLHRDGLVSMRVPSRYETGAEGDLGGPGLAPDVAVRARVEVIVEQESVLRGMVTYVMPEGQRRLQDVLNLKDQFLILHDGDLVHLVNKRRILRVTAIS